MTRRRTPRPAQAQALIVLAALPLVLTTSNVGVTHASATRTADSGPAPVAGSVESVTAEDLPDLPEQTLEAVPAAFQVPERPALGTPRPGDVPWVALQAYQRAADILGEVQPSCRLSWTLLAAVGQVESEHGTIRGGELGDDGVVSPDLRTRPLDGTGQRPAVEDTDGGEVDGDETWDRAVGPMQLLPGVWSLVGVDGDGDGTRSPQDVDDAALAAAVYLCAVGTDLSESDGAAEALAEYNGAEGYADQVLAVGQRYADRDFAVSGAPETSSIGSTLDDGRGSPARESKRALREAQEEREKEQVLTARRAEPTPDPKAGATGAPSPTAEPTESPTARPTGSPTARPTGAATDEPTESPAAQPTDVAGGITEGATDDARPQPSPAEDPADGATDGATDQADAEPAEQPTGTDTPADPGATPEPGDPQTEDAVDTEDVSDRPTEGPVEADADPGEAEDAADPSQATQPDADPTEPAEDAAEGGEQAPAGEGEGTEEPPAGETDGPAAEETDEPAPEEQGTTTTALTGVLSTCGEGLCLDGAPLDLSLADDLTGDAGVDLDDDGVVQPLAQELTGLQGRTVELLVVEGSVPLLVVAVDGHVVVPG